MSLSMNIIWKRPIVVPVKVTFEQKAHSCNQFHLQQFSMSIVQHINEISKEFIRRQYKIVLVASFLSIYQFKVFFPTMRLTFPSSKPQAVLIGKQNISSTNTQGSNTFSVQTHDSHHYNIQTRIDRSSKFEVGNRVPDVMRMAYIPLNKVPMSQSSIHFEDEIHQEKPKVKPELAEVKIEIQLKALKPAVKMGEACTLPAMLAVKTSGGQRVNVDLVCVLDISGSMRGQKLELLKDTMTFLMNLLTPADRLSIVTFNDQSQALCGLKSMNKDIKPRLSEMIQKVQAGGGTSIGSGVECAFSILKYRKHRNEVTSIFLLSDGQDDEGESKVKRLIERYDRQLGVYSIHCFGFGGDHDEEMMSKICKMKNGGFYYIQKLSILDEAFSHALGGLISVVGNQINLNLKKMGGNLASGIKISKFYQNPNVKMINKDEYQIQISQLRSGITKDFVFELSIPQYGGDVREDEKNVNVLQCQYSGDGIDGQKIAGKSNLNLFFLNKNEKIAGLSQNEDVMENLLRVKAAEVIERSLKSLDQQKFKEAQQGIDLMISEISVKANPKSAVIKSLTNDLKTVKKSCEMDTWKSDNRKAIRSSQMTYMNQDNCQFSNKAQMQMVEYARSVRR